MKHNENNTLQMANTKRIQARDTNQSYQYFNRSCYKYCLSEGILISGKINNLKIHNKIKTRA